MNKDFTDADLRGAIFRDANCSGADFVGANLSGADFTRADCSGADFTGADLSGADSLDANCSGADFLDADLSGPVFVCTNLSRVNLTGAILPPGIPAIENIDGKILQAIEAGGRLDMRLWHTCQTTHCRAGWAVVLAGAEGKALEEKIGTSAAAALIYAASGNPIVPDWYDSDEEAYEDIVSRAREFSHRMAE